MSFGSLGQNAISALNLGAKEAGCMHNTGEGGVSKYHKKGADLMWQLGTGYFGARKDGKFDLDTFAAEIEATPAIRCVEIKLSQGAKPGKGGVLPGAKVTPEIAETRKVKVWETVLSPNAHSMFSSVDEMIDWIEVLAGRTGLPIGVKSAVGESAFWVKLAKRMKERNEGPDFITIDGGEGGTGAAPLTYADHVALPFKIGFARVYEIFQKAGICDRLVWIGSGKLGFPDRAVIGFALGCDLIHVARESMLAIGCIQAQKCHTGHCPVGVATQNKWLRNELLALSHTVGYEHPGQFTAQDVELSTGVNQFSTLAKVMGYSADEVAFTGMKELQPV
jgi:glutamate synthase (ferredoxin)